ncbi:unnamed protein product [marine sediment metagenome]|uniref:Uncharacterized protein n=1 Tax=marine sediment metagenome TaxID=412755 RepID=X1A349_9ZZZZ
MEKERDFDEEIKGLEKRIDREGFEKFEEWLGTIETYPIKKNRIALSIRKRPYIIFFLVIFILSFLLPLSYIPYVATISAILIIVSILPCCPSIRLPPNLEDWLNRHPNVSNVLIWEE